MVGVDLKIKSDFRRLCKAQFYDFEGGHSILHRFKSFIRFYEELYPFRWSISDRERVGRNYWKSPTNAKLFIEQLNFRFPIHVHRDWKVLDHQLLIECHGKVLSGEDTLVGLLKNSFPQFFWEGVWGLPGVSGEERRLFLDRSLLSYGQSIATQQDLSQFGRCALLDFPGGPSLLTAHQGSHQAILCGAYPELIIQFKAAYHGYWKNLKKTHFIQKLMKYFDIIEKEDWYTLSANQLAEVYGRFVRKGHLIELLECTFPEEIWSYGKFSDRIQKKSRQRYLYLKLKEIFKDEVIMEEYVVNYSNNILVFDFYIPERSIVIEYQGEQHYIQSLNWVSLEHQNQRDLLKKQICSLKGLHFIDVPYWWDNTTHHLLQFLNSNNHLPSSQ
eukprot:TRINITY_DN3388_c4_g1_i1.p1 TRINITY_DN3388_c4_g1~~TRINITY_DN3388_c4_g1_i1.p1  ORF type:complete len:409 (-),score=75.70 TRINITY_DN3388_c4_g1_i1:11-1168(-)